MNLVDRLEILRLTDYPDFGTFSRHGNILLVTCCTQPCVTCYLLTVVLSFDVVEANSYCIRCGPGEEHILDILPGGTELGTQVKTGNRSGRTLSQ